MNPLTVGLLSTVCIFSGAVMGFWLQKRLPSHHLGKDSHEIVKLGSGMIVTLTALVLGLLVSSAKSSFDAANASIVQGAAKVVLLDRALAHCGSDAKSIRDQLQRTLAGGIQTVWPREPTGGPALSEFESSTGMEMVQEKLREFKPQNDVQQQWLGQARQTAVELSETRWLLIEQSQNSLPTLFLVVLVTWLTLLFITFGMFAPRNGTVIAVLLAGAGSVSAAIVLVLELNRPLEGLIKASNAPLLNALQHLGK